MDIYGNKYITNSKYAATCIPSHLWRLHQMSNQNERSDSPGTLLDQLSAWAHAVVELHSQGLSPHQSLSLPTLNTNKWECIKKQKKQTEKQFKNLFEGLF